MFKKRFQSKDVGETITAGDCLRRKREELGLHLGEIAKKLGIKEEYLENLESGSYKELPPQVYVRGFIKSYAGFLGIDGSQLIRIYNREMSFLHEDEGKKKKDKPGRVKLGDYLVITPKLITLLLSLSVFAVLGYYFYHQVNSFNSKPYLYVESPAADEVVKERELTVKGKTEEDATLRINGQDVSVGGDGLFSQKITLSEGRNLLVIEARNRFNKMDQKEINIVYENPNPDAKTITEVPAVDPDAATETDADETETADAEEDGSVAGAAIVAKDKDVATPAPAANPESVSAPRETVPAPEMTATPDPNETAVLDKTGKSPEAPSAQTDAD